MDIREQITQEVEGIAPLDALEEEHRQEVLRWINSGAEIFRIQKPATPPRHLVVYFILVDGEHMFLCDHIKGQSWLPTGGHVDENEHPKDAAARECLEELYIAAEFLHDKPLMVSIAQTVGVQPVHEDVMLWYVLKGDRMQELQYDAGEFNGVKWFHVDDIPLDQGDPNMGRFLEKLRNFKES